MAPNYYLLFVLLIFVPNACNCKRIAKIKTLLIFGDSTVDPGNNNFINTLFKANHLPYGRNFPGHISTGRFSDGKLIPDFVASKLKIKSFIPPYLQPGLSVNELLTGVSFASAGSGYDELTSSVSSVISITKQVEYFREYKEKLRRSLGHKAASKIIRRALVVVSAGTNDFVFSFYVLGTRKSEYNIEGYQNFVLNNVQNFVKELYNLGCRIIVVTGLPPVGCLPMQMATQGPFVKSCVYEQNQDSQYYNTKLVILLQKLNKSLSGGKILYADVYTPLMDLCGTPFKFGFAESTKGCCGTGVLEAGPMCTEVTPFCPNLNSHVFFDAIHPTQPAYEYMSNYLSNQILPQITGQH